MPDVSTGYLAESVRGAFATPAPEALGQMATAAAGAGPWDSAAIAVLCAQGTVIPVAASHPSARAAQQCEQDLGQGPNRDAVIGRCTVAVDDLLTEPRWPLWRPATAQLGIAAAVAVPLFTDTMLGVLTFYHGSNRTWQPDDLRRAEIVGAQVSVVVAHVTLQRNLLRAIESRTVIGQAQGMLIERHGLDQPQAFALLRKYSQQRNVKLVALARQLVTTGTLDDHAVIGAARAGEPDASGPGWELT